jgi:hypothetical protein
MDVQIHECDHRPVRADMPLMSRIAKWRKPLSLANVRLLAEICRPGGLTCCHACQVGRGQMERRGIPYGTVRDPGFITCGLSGILASCPPSDTRVPQHSGWTPAYQRPGVGRDIAKPERYATVGRPQHSVLRMLSRDPSGRVRFGKRESSRLRARTARMHIVGWRHRLCDWLRNSGPLSTRVISSALRGIFSTAPRGEAAVALWLLRSARRSRRTLARALSDELDSAVPHCTDPLVFEKASSFRGSEPRRPAGGPSADRPYYVGLF